MQDSLRLVTLTFRSASADVALLQRGYEAVRTLLIVDGIEPVAFVGRGNSGAVWLHVLCGGRCSWREVRDVWCSVASGGVASYRLKGVAVLGVLGSCESLFR